VWIVIRFVLIPLSRGGELFSFSYLLSFFISGSSSWAGWGWLVAVVDYGGGGGGLLAACLLACLRLACLVYLLACLLALALWESPLVIYLPACLPTYLLPADGASGYLFFLQPQILQPSC
jgi:hypothetical protein